MKFTRLVTSYTVNLDLLYSLYPSLSSEQVTDFMHRRKLATKDTAKFAELIEKAIQKHQKIRIVYAAKEDNFEEEARVVVPLAFQVKKPKTENQDYVYLVAYNFENLVRTYRFDRLKEVKTTSKPAKYPEGGYSTYYDYYSDDITPDYYDSNLPLLDFAKDLIPS